MEKLPDQIEPLLNTLIEWGMSPDFYMQIAIIALAIFLAPIFSAVLKRKLPLFKQPPSEGGFLAIRAMVYNIGELVSPFLIVLLLTVGASLTTSFIENSWLIKISQSLAIIFFLYKGINITIRNRFINALLRWVGIPVAILQVFGWLDDVSQYLDSVALQLGNIRISLLAVFRGAVFGAILFWLGRHSNDAGQKAIRGHAALDIGTRELFAKLFEIALFTILFILLLQFMGINLTTLAVLGGAVGVGLGFGLQQIAANFISGMIILIDRSITVGNHIELEDGRFGIVREIKMRYAVIESYEGKEIMVPNETFITSSFTNWSHKDDKQRYSINFSVAYSTDLHKLFSVVREVVASHPQVISGDDVPLEEQPDAEIDEFADSGVNILVEYWMHGVDDGRNRVDADLKLMIWDALKENDIQMPFPQREVRIVGGSNIAG